MLPGHVQFARTKSMDHEGDIIITFDMNMKLVGMVRNWKTTWPKIFPIERGNLETGNRKRLKKEMRTKTTTTMNKITKFSLEGKKGTGHDTHKPERISLSIHLKYFFVFPYIRT